MADEMVRQSVLDRLTGADLLSHGGGGQGRRARTWEESVELLERNVMRDLEQLLNTRQISEPAESPYDHLANSLYNYGLVDFASMSADASETAERIRRFIKESIQRFEPRLMDVAVVDPGEGETGSGTGRSKRQIRFRVEATLRTDPEPERVEFDTVLETTSKRFKVNVGPNA